MKPQLTFGAIGALLAGCAIVGLTVGVLRDRGLARSPWSSTARKCACSSTSWCLPLRSPSSRPRGRVPNVATSGAAKDCNVRMIFIDRVDITKPDGSPAYARQFPPARLPRGPDQADKRQRKRPDADLRAHRRCEGRAPARTGSTCMPTPIAWRARPSRRRRRQANADLKRLGNSAAASGEHMEVRLEYERAAARKTSNEVKFFSSTNPSFYRTF